MASRAALRQQVTALLGTVEGDPAYLHADGTSRLDDYLTAAHAAVVEDLRLANPDLYQRSTALAPDGPATYPLVAAAPDLVGVIRLTLGDAAGLLLRERPVRQLRDAGEPAYALIGVEPQVTLVTNARVPSDAPLYLIYEAAPAFEAAAEAEPEGIPPRFHDVLALRAAQLAFAQGGEQRFPPELAERLADRMGQLVFAVGRRSLDPATYI